MPCESGRCQNRDQWSYIDLDTNTSPLQRANNDRYRFSSTGRDSMRERRDQHTVSNGLSNGREVDEDTISLAADLRSLEDRRWITG